MSRAVLVLALAAAIALPRTAHLTILSSQSKDLPGYRISSTDQIGCETTHDYPSQKTEEEATRRQQQLIADTEREIAKSYEHYLKGAQPFKRFRDALDPSLRAATQPRGAVTPRTHLLAVEVELNLKAGTPPMVAAKIPFELVLAQTFRPGVFEKYPLIDEGQFLMELRFSWNSLPSYFDRLVAFALRHPEKLKAWDEHPESVSPGSPRDVDREAALLRARALARVLGKQRYGNLIAEAQHAFDKNGVLIFMLLIASDVNADEMPALLAAFGDPAVSELFRPLSPR
jgi:hypothetical protein